MLTIVAVGMNAKRFRVIKPALLIIFRVSCIFRLLFVLLDDDDGKPHVVLGSAQRVATEMRTETWDL